MARFLTRRLLLSLITIWILVTIVFVIANVLPNDVDEVALDVLRHRIVLSYEALADDLDADTILTRVLRAVPMPDVVLQP